MESKSPVDILLVSSKYPPEPAGSGLRAHLTYRRLAQKYSFRYKVLCGSVIFNKPTHYSFEGVSVYRIACKPFKGLKNREEIIKESLPAKIVRRLKNGVNYLLEASLTWIYLFRYGSRFGIIHIFGKNFVTAAVLTYAKIVNKPLILESCNVGEKVGQYEPWFIKMALGRGLPHRSRLVCISERLKKIWLNSGYTGEIWCRPNPVDGSLFYIDRENKFIYRGRLGLFNNEDIVLMAIGKIRPLKNQIFLVEVLKGLPEKYKLVIVGPTVNSAPYTSEDSKYVDSIKEKIEEYDLSDRVKIEENFIDNVDEYMKASDIYLMPSKMEACSTVILEALACGIPVVAHRIEGVTTEWIKEGINGYLAPLDVEAFRKKIMIASSLDKERLEENAGDMAKQTSTDFIDEKYVSLIKELTGD